MILFTHSRRLFRLLRFLTQEEKKNRIHHVLVSQSRWQAFLIRFHTFCCCWGLWNWNLLPPRKRWESLSVWIKNREKQSLLRYRVRKFKPSVQLPLWLDSAKFHARIVGWLPWFIDSVRFANNFPRRRPNHQSINQPRWLRRSRDKIKYEWKWKITRCDLQKNEISSARVCKHFEIKNFKNQLHHTALGNSAVIDGWRRTIAAVMNLRGF